MVMVMVMVTAEDINCSSSEETNYVFSGFGRKIKRDPIRCDPNQQKV